jgi:formate hydrogenlyase transcriptional activator
VSPAPAPAEQRHALVLRAWEAINAERDLGSVLAAVADVLVPVVPFGAISIVAMEGLESRLYALHAVGMPRGQDESAEAFARRAQVSAEEPVPVRPRTSYEASDLQRQMNAGEPYSCPDLFAKAAWFPHDFRLAAAGIRAYAAIPLRARGTLIGLAIFSRGAPAVFTAEQLAVLSDVSRAIAVGVANALANEEVQRLRDRLHADNVALRAQLGDAPWSDGIVGDSPALRRVLAAVEQAAATDATVLITGETGTGKELIARALHRRSPRAHGPLVTVQCTAIPDTLLASELFGHERGAFTGAMERRRGRFEQAHGGTLFLDEIGELLPDTQVMLLRVLQEREFERLGGSETVRVDVRIVAATNCDLGEAVRAGRFRSDLYYRLNVFPIRMPPLRERAEDVPLLVAHFAAKHGARSRRPIARIDRRTLSMLRSYDWPGNVRELENVVERAVILSRDGTLRVDRDSLAGAAPMGDIETQLRRQEGEAIDAALRATAGRVAGPDGAAKRLGIAPSTLEFRIKRLGIDKFKYRGGRRG